MRLRRKVDEFGFGLACDELDLNVYKGGGKGGGTAVVEQPVVTPTPPIQDDASIEMSSEQEDAKKKAKQGKGKLKIPLATEVDTGLKV